MSTAKTYKVTKKFIKEAYEAANQEWKKKLKEQFPAAFESAPFRFKKENFVTTSVNPEFPLYVGYGNAPDGLGMKCLMVDGVNWDLEVRKGEGYCANDYVLVFRKKY